MIKTGKGNLKNHAMIISPWVVYYILAMPNTNVDAMDAIQQEI